MRLDRSRPFGLASYLLVSLFACASTDSGENKDKILAETVFGTLRQQHYAPLAINDDFSKKAFASYIKELDANKRFLLQSDVDKLRKYELRIDDDVQSGNFETMKEAEGLLAQRVKQVEGFYEELLAKPFDFNKDEEIEFDYDKRKFASNPAEMKEEWRKYYKYQTLVQLVSKLQQGTKGSLTVDSVRAKMTPKMEEDARAAVKKSNKDFFHRLSQVNESDRQQEFLNALTHLYDPHTDFYAPATKENFDIQLSGRLEGIGAQLQQKDGNITVSNVVPGSASWRQGQLKVNDVIMKVAQDGEDPVDVTDMRLDDAIKMIRGKKGTKVILTIKKTDASIINIPIVRDVVVLEETFAKSAILKNPEGKGDVGYLLLPSFYVDFNNRGGNSCADDVRKELEKLKAAGVKSLIFDLRNNGGGSLSDVVKIVGYFIDRGPVVQVKTRTGGIRVLNDEEPGTLFDGPLAVMINPFSASASEIMAAAIQDYKRGIIVGSVHSFGKGTVQQIVDLDQSVPFQYGEAKPLGSVKLTTQKFYRIDGGTTQLHGVASDLVLPDVYRYIDFGEKELDNAMPFDQISKARYETFEGGEASIKRGVTAADGAVKSSPYFTSVDQLAHRLKKKQDDQSFTLNLYKYVQETEENKREDKALTKLSESMTKNEVAGFPGNQPDASDTLATARRKSFSESIKKDAYLTETIKALNGMGQWVAKQ